ncbi:MAG: ATP-binding protein [Planctomycetota bacterium]
MWDTPEQLVDRIRLGEDSLLGCKAIAFAGAKVRSPARNSLADELAALANASGGLLILGVDDKTHRISGIAEERLDDAERFVTEICHDAIRPPLLPRILRQRLPLGDGSSRAVLRVDVPRSLFVHESPGGYFYRVGSTKRTMSPECLARLMQQRSQARLIRFDEQVVPGISIEDLDPVLVDRFRTPRSKDERGVFLRKLAMAREGDDGALRPTVAGVLLGAKEPQRWLSHAFLQAVAYRGTDIASGVGAAGYQLDARDITGPLDEQVIDGCRFVQRNMRIEATKTVGRLDVPQYDLTAVFEALVNAVAHRDYSMHGSKVRLRMFADRLEIYSPGALANTMTVESLALRQSTRNEAVTSLLAKCRVPKDLAWLKTSRKTLMDRRGEGVAIILERSERLAKKRPFYDMIDESELRLTILAASALDHAGG